VHTANHAPLVGFFFALWLFFAAREKWVLPQFSC